jgi:hypothetical protein
MDRVSRIVRLGVSVAASGDFGEQVKVADAAWELLRDRFGLERMFSSWCLESQVFPCAVPIELE